MVCLSLLVALTLGQADAGAEKDAVPSADPAAWRLSDKLTGELRAALVADFTAKVTQPNEAALTEDEANRLLDDPRAQAVYGKRTVAIAAPSNPTQQRHDHQARMKELLSPAWVAKAVDFARENDALLTKVEARSGVKREVIVSVLGWETAFGTVTGSYDVFNVFTSQAFFLDDAYQLASAGAPPPPAERARIERIRSRARKNLVALVRTCKARGIDPLAVKGSWAGAIGLPQFMPESLVYADDGDGDGKIDLFGVPDSVASIGRFLSVKGYAKNAREAVWAYNHDQAYVDGVLTVAQTLQKKLHRLRPNKRPIP